MIRSARFCLDHLGALFGQATGRNRRVELLLGRIDHCLDEAVHGLSLFLRDVRERVSVPESLMQLILRQPEVGRRRLEPSQPARMGMSSVGATAVKAPEAPEEERRITGLDPFLELRPLLLGERARVDRLLDAVLHPLLERLLERARLDAELRRSVVDDRLTAVGRLQRIRCGDGDGCSQGDCDHERRRRACNELDPRVLFHAGDETRAV